MVVPSPPRRWPGSSPPPRPSSSSSPPQAATPRPIVTTRVTRAMRWRVTRSPLGRRLRETVRGRSVNGSLHRAASSSGRPERRERVGDLEQARAEAVDLGRAAACAPRAASRACRLEHVPPQQDPLQVGGRDVVPERGGVDLAQLREREGRRREGEAGVRVRELAAQPLPAREDDLVVVEGKLGQLVDRVPAVSSGRLGSTSAGRGRGTRSRALGRPGLRGGSLQEPSCSRCASSRTSTFVARWRRIEPSSVSPGPSMPPGRDHAPAKGSRARCPEQGVQPAAPDLAGRPRARPAPGVC